MQFVDFLVVEIRIARDEFFLTIFHLKFLLKFTKKVDSKPNRKSVKPFFLELMLEVARTLKLTDGHHKEGNPKLFLQSKLLTKFR